MAGPPCVSNRLTRTDREYQYTFTYDATYRVTQSQPSLTVPNPVFQQTTETFTYDAVGNRLTGPGYTEANTFTQDYQYDYENRIKTITKQVTGDPNTDTITFKYDPFGRRIEKNVSTYENSIPTTYKYTYVYDNEDIILEIQEKTQSGNTTTTTTAYTHGPGIDEPLMLERGGQKYYYHADGLGSITSITDANQAVVNRYAYDSFGAIKKSETIRNSYAFTGREFDSEIGLYYYRARYYDPEVGRFVSKDPIGFNAGDVNVFNYVAGNSVNRIDPLGLDWMDDVTNFSAGFGDALLFGTGQYLRDQLGISGVDRCSKAYKYGSWSSFALGAARLGYAGLAKGISIVAASGLEASAYRESLKKVFRLGLGTNFRSPNLAKYGTDEALRAAAGRTNPYINTYGAGVAAAGAFGGSGCGCEE